MAKGEQCFEQLQYPPNPPSLLRLDSDNAADLKPRSGKWLSEEEFSSFLDKDGRLVDEHALRQAVFQGGIDPCIQRDVWQFLFELYPFHSTNRERKIMLTDYTMKYTALKNRWREILHHVTQDGEKLICPVYLRELRRTSSSSIGGGGADETGGSSNCSSQAELQVELDEHDEQQRVYMELQAQVYAGREKIELESLLYSVRIIDKDVPRTDRELPYYAGPVNPNLQLIRELLVTYSAYHPAIGYVQGMNDIASRFLVVFDSEVEAYWCFRNYMEHVKSDFVEDGMLNKLNYTKELLLEVDAVLLEYLQHLEVGDLTFCHRWMLLCFKREFSWEESLRCFEILSSHHLEVSCMTAERTRAAARRKDFLQQGGKNRVEEAPSNSDFTFDVFMCVAILIEHRGPLFQCLDVADVFRYINNLTHKLNLDEVLVKAEWLFFKYCNKSVRDCFQVIDTPSLWL